MAIASTRARLFSEVRTFICVKCREYLEEKRIYDLEDVLRCPLCRATTIGMVEEDRDKLCRIIETLSRMPKRSKALKTWKKVLESSKLIARYGKLAAVALAGDGVTPRRAAMVLEEENRLRGKFFELVMEAEKKAFMEKFHPMRA